MADNKNQTSTSQLRPHPMVGGEGPQSYAQNSIIQKQAVEDSKDLIHQAIIEKLELQSILVLDNSCSNTFRIADLGCSVGPNTFVAIQNIINAIELKSHKTLFQGNKTANPEFQVFFNDLLNNDFNTLFRLLPPSRNYFTNAVPGSFHGRIFPKSSLHFVHSSTSLHWLSKVPEEVVDSKSLAWNKGSILCTGLVKEVSEAYSNQFNNDMHTFLKARAPEIVHGGLMVLILLGLPDGVSTSQTRSGMIHDLLWSCLNDLAISGLLKQEMVDSFNIPFYFPNAKEMTRIIERNGYFSIEKMQELFKSLGPTVSLDIQSHIVSPVRVGLQGVIKEHFGHDMVDEIFNYFSRKLANTDLTFMAEENSQNIVDLFILLKRKPFD